MSPPAPAFRRWLLAILWLAALLVPGAAAAEDREAEGPLPVYIFWHEGCPYCVAAREDLGRLAAEDPRVELRPLEIGVEPATDDLFGEALAHFGHAQAGVPLVVIGDRSFLGYYDGGRSSGQYRDAVAACAGGACPDIVAALSQALGRSPAGLAPGVSPPARPDAAGHQAPPLPRTVRLPLLGEIETATLSLPALTILLAAVDGFNPCAMWVLVVLIGLLLGLRDERRMWILGAAFLGATAAMYFAVMAAWLNLILFLGAVFWVRLAVGALAIGGGLYFLREYWTRPEAACRVVDPTRRQRIMAAFERTVSRNSLVLSVLGIMALAAMVNFIELLCSAGIPAVYTQILALSDLPKATYYGYLWLYIAIFMLDDVAIFATAMFALRVSGLTGSYARVSHLIGGVILLSLGAVMVLRPDLLSFG